MTSTVRRVVTTTDQGGRSAIASDARPAVGFGDETEDAITLAVIWEAKTPVDYGAMGGDPGEGFTQLPMPATVRMVQLVVAAHGTGEGALDIPMHRTDTLDLIFIAAGEIELVVESGMVLLAAGDYLVMQGDVHGWRNTGPEPCTIVAAMLGAPAR